jgi:hypothetical protein
MTKKSMFIFVALCAMSTHPPAYAQDTQSYDQNWMVLSIELNKNDFALGDEIVIDLELINFADHPMTFRTDPHRFVILSSRMGERSRISDGAQVMAGKLVTLKSEERFKDRLVGKVIEGAGYIAKGRLKSEGRYKVEGMFVQFPTYRLFLEKGPGKYTLQATYSTGAWVHRSNKISIDIRK